MFFKKKWSNATINANGRNTIAIKCFTKKVLTQQLGGKQNRTRVFIKKDLAGQFTKTAIDNGRFVAGECNMKIVCWRKNNFWE